MSDLIIEPSSTTPRVELKASDGCGRLQGASFPEDAFAFYAPVISWLADYRGTGRSAFEMIVRLDYFNTSSSKCLLDLVLELEKLAENGGNVRVRWQYLEDDEDMFETGKELAEDTQVDFVLEAY